MNRTIKLFWGSNLKANIGNAYGYYVHNRNLRHYVSKIINICDNPEKATDAIYIISPEFFRGKIPNVKTYLFTMFEGTTIPEQYKTNMDKADYLLAPSKFVKKLFDQYYDPLKTFVVNHGVEKKFKFKKRKFPTNRPFRFLWVGAPNPRKGWQEIMTVWDKLFKDNPNIQLYIKTTRVGKIEKMSNVILDGRDLDDKQLVKLYHSAHCFVFPTRGEGFGLTLAEAMRTGLPCISTYYSGVTDFFDDKAGYIIKHNMGEGRVIFIGDKNVEDTMIAFPNVEDLAIKMAHVYNNYQEALTKGQKAAKRISSKFTWERSASTLLSILETNNTNW